MKSMISSVKGGWFSTEDSMRTALLSEIEGLGFEIVISVL